MEQVVMDFLARVKRAAPEHFVSSRVLEIGSRNINGSARECFTDCVYTGVDRRGGRGVDIVAMGEDLKYSDGSFDTALSTESFEHTLGWPEIMVNMRRMLRPGGLLIVTAAAFDYPAHGPKDGPTYKNLQPPDFIPWRDESLLFYEEDRHSNHIMLAWRKPK